ncbi:MAG: hypothetical protein EOM23_10860 [Candidatus Moranbacteria bacterium]|nr:hypothetical protein [Candidatus Moranbacteria bacterium]
MALNNMLFKEKTKHSGEIEIKIIRNGKAKLIWQEYRFLHYIRKHFGVNFPKLFGITGYLTRKAVYSNLLVTTGKGLISGRINGVGTPAAPTYMAIGTGTNAAAAGDTALQTEATGNGYDRMSGTASTETTDTADDTNQLIGSWIVTSSKAITEMGILNAASVGTLLVRNVFSAYTLQNGDTFQITHKLKHA